MSTTTANVHQSRWGYHPVSYETFRTLKALKKRYWQTVYAVARWRRWDRKTVHQHGPEPKYCPTFVDESGHYKTVTHKVDGMEFRGSVYVPKTLVDHGILEAFEQARMPQENPEDVKPLAISDEKIDLLYERVEAWFEEN
jgi:hypothetical protein